MSHFFIFLIHFLSFRYGVPFSLLKSTQLHILVFNFFFYETAYFLLYFCFSMLLGAGGGIMRVLWQEYRMYICILFKFVLNFLHFYHWSISTPPPLQIENFFFLYMTCSFHLKLILFICLQLTTARKRFFFFFLSQFAKNHFGDFSFWKFFNSVP